MLKKKRIWLGAMISVIFLGLFFRQMSLSDLQHALGEARYVYLAPAILIYFISLAFRAIRCHFLLRHLKPLSFGTLFGLLSIGYMVNNISPLRLGDFARSYLLGEREEISKASALGNIAVERTLDGVVLVLFMAVAGISLSLTPFLTQLGYWAGIAFISVLSAMIIIVLFPSYILRFVAWFIKFIPVKLGKRMHELAVLIIDGFNVFRRPKLLAASVLLSVPIWLCEAWMYYVVGLGFQLQLSLEIVIMITAASNLAVSIPSSQGGVGPFEYFAAQTVMLTAVAPELAAAYALVLHITLLLPVTLLGMFYLGRYKMALRELLTMDLRQKSD